MGVTVTGIESRDYRVVILGAGRSVTGSLPSAMVSVDREHRLLDWLLAAFAVLREPQICFVGGYEVEAVEARYPDLRFFFNSDWAETGPVKSLSLVPFSPESVTYICYADVVFRPAAVREVEAMDCELVLAVDTRWRSRYDNRSRGDLDRAEKILSAGGRVADIGTQVETSAASAEFAGLLKVSGSVARRLRQAIHSEELSARAGLPDLIRLFLRDGVRPAVVDVRGNWAELDAPQDLARFALGTKAESLERLRPLVRHSSIGEQVSFSHQRWRGDRRGAIGQIRSVFGDTRVIVRSSALTEDSWQQSSAGAYTSVLDVPAAGGERLEAAIDEVFRSYGDPLGENQVLVQEMLCEVTTSGVVMTRTATLGAPYYVINFDDRSARTDTVTSGEDSSIRTVFLLRGAEIRSELPAELRRLMKILSELERLVGHSSLDVEFAFTRDGRGHVLQVRPIAVSSRDLPVDDERIVEATHDAVRYFGELQRPSPFVLGSSTCFSVMADWNPAEMIGTKPNRLALSLYRTLITDESWARQRAEYGYRDVRPSNLIVEFLGHPYVDVRVDFNSFVPAALGDDLAARLVDHYVERLGRHPELHDKVEFEILFTCLALDFDRRSESLLRAGFSAGDVACLRKALRDLTGAGMARCEGDLEALESFRQRCDSILTADLPPLELAHLMLEDVRRIGVPLFSHLARHAFIAVTFLSSLRDAGIITEEDLESFLAAVRTVASAMQEDAARVASGELGWEHFVATYGHLRPGSYDITAPCYSSAPEEFLRPMIDERASRPAATAGSSWSAETRQVIDRELRKLGLGGGVSQLETFLRQAIEGRELGKFTFMRNVNAALEALAAFGEAHGISREDLSHIRIGELMGLRAANAEKVRETLLRLARAGREAFFVTQAVCLPSQLFSEADFHCFEQLAAEPNFVTRKKVRAEVISLAGRISPEVDLEGKIVLLPNADPGFDWLFARRIAGLITMYGGVNSHMAIRAAELRLPAAIGVGELLYERIEQSQILALDCASRQIHSVR